jgi:hypothetical protein
MKPIRKTLRNEATPAERELWNVLRQSNLGGYKFRRQQSVGRYIVDFYCPLERLASFRPERVLFRPCGVNLRACLCGVPMYASAQTLDFLAWTKNTSFPNRKPIVSHPEFPDGN